MGGQEGNRGYLVQAIIALLQSLDASSWETVAIEPDAASEKIDVRWIMNDHIRATQIKSSQNQIGKAEAERWAAELKRSCIAHEYELVLVGPVAQSVIELRSSNGVAIPCPKSLDLTGLLNEAAHLLGKFLTRESMHQQSPQTRELMVRALVTELSRLSTTGNSLKKQALVDLLKQWVTSVAFAPNSSWEQVNFEKQRGIENAVAGKRLGPLDVDACPAFSICDEIMKELQRGHVYELAGTSGCGKSITAWQVARRFERNGYLIWRPRAFAMAHDLLSEVPTGRSLLVFDDAHKYGAMCASRLSELSNAERKVLLVSTVENTLLSQVICLSPQKCVDELTTALDQIRGVLLPIVQQFDNLVGHRSGDTPLERRIEDARRQKKPWEVFWIIRGGWQTARREIESVRQFPGASEALLWIATSQVLSCDAGVARERIIAGLGDLGISEDMARGALGQLDRLGLILLEDSIRTKHLIYARQVLEICFKSTNSREWAQLAQVVTQCVLGTAWPLKGVAWLLGAGLGYSEAFRLRHGTFRILLEPLTHRCLAEQEDVGWAAGCMSRLISGFDLSATEILAFGGQWHVWTMSGNPTAAYFCGDIINALINKSPRDGIGYREVLSRPLIERVDVNRLVEIVNAIILEDFYSFAHLLDRMCFAKPPWAADFICRLDWDRIRTIILGSSSEHAYAIDAMIGCIVNLASSMEHRALEYVEAVVPYVARTINDDPSCAVGNMKQVFWMCLSYGPKFLMGGRVPNRRQKAIAQSIVAKVEPRAISAAMEKAVSRDLEGLAWTLAFARQVDDDFVDRVVATLNQDVFFEATATDWKEQTGELQQLLRFFTTGKQFKPASDWIRANKGQIQGMLKPLLVLLAPDVAIQFHLEGKGIQLVQPHNMKWSETAGAIMSLRTTDRKQCKRIVSQKLEELRAALYHLSLESLRHIVHVFKMLFELSPDLFEKFVDGINLDDERCLKLVKQLRSNQPNELSNYRKLARSGTKAGGKLGVLSAEFLRRLTN